MHPWLPTEDCFMSVNKFQCPECQANLKTADPVPSGKKIRCPKCQSLFTIPGPEEEDTVLINAESQEEPDKEPDTDPDDVRPRAKKKKVEEAKPPPPPRKKARPPMDED